MSSGFGGGAPPIMQNDSIVVHTDGCLGPCDSVLTFGMAQSALVFLPTDVEPFWMTVAEQNERRLDRPEANAATLAETAEQV
jgi:hypothetical protein